MNEFEVKSYTQSKDNYDVDVYGFTNGSLTDEEITTKQNQFKKGTSLSTITNYDNHDEYQLEASILPASYENILEEINIKTINYNSVITIRESNKANLEDTTFWILGTADGAIVGAATVKIIDSAIKDFKKLNKLK